MGQQQLLLIALSVIIVGAAVAVGVNIFREGSQQAKIDVFYQQASASAAKFGEYYQKPTTMGGFGNKLPTDGDGNLENSEIAQILGLVYATDVNNAPDEGLYVSQFTEKTNVSYDADGDGTNEALDGVLIQLSDASSDYSGSFFATEYGEAVWNAGGATRPTN